MSQPTTVSPTPPPAANRDQNAFQGVASLIESRIREAQNALWWSEFIRSILRIFIGVFVAVLLWVVLDQWIYTPGMLARVAGFFVLLGWVVHQAVTRVLPVIKGTIRPEYAARSLERDVPEMRQELTSYVTLRDQSDSPSLNGKVIRSIGAHAASRLRSHDALPVEATGTLRWWIAAASLMAIFFIYAALSPKNSFHSASRLVMPVASIEPAKRVKIRDVIPGDAEVLAGRTVEVSAAVEGLRQDEPVVCRWQLKDREAQITLVRDADSGRFAGEVTLDHASSGQVPYQIVAGDDVAGPYYLSVQDVPVVAVQSIRYEPPAYTQKQPHTSSSAAITALDGTRVTVTARTNRPIEKATIQFNPKPLGDLVHATAGESAMSIDDSGTLVTITFPVRYARQRSAAVQLESYRIKVWDKIGQTNPSPIVYPIRVNADLSPEVTIVMPRQSPKNIPIDAQQIVEIHAADADFGLQQIEIEIRRGIEVLERATLWSDPLGKKGNQIAEYRFRPHEHFLRVGDAVQVTAIATDNRQDESDPLVEPNATKTDPVELRITMSEPVPNEPAAGDGLSSPDNKPAADPNASEASGEGGQGGSGGSSAAGGKGESGKQSGGSSGGGEGGESGEPQDGDQENQSGSSGGSGKQSSDRNEGGDENPSEGSGAGQGGSSQGDASNSNPSSKPAGDSMENSEASDSGSDPATQGDADPNQKPSGDESGSENAEGGNQGAGNQPQGSKSSDPQNAGKPSGDSKNGAGQGRADEGMIDPSKQDSPNQNASNSGGSGQQSSESQDADAQDAGSQGASGSQDSSAGGGEAGKPETPEHDGEAFERIRDYLDKKKQEQAGQDAQNNSAAKSESHSGQDGENPSGSKTEGAGKENESSKGNGAGKESESGQGNESNEGQDSEAASSDAGAMQSDANKPGGDDRGAGKSATDPAGSEAAGDAAAENQGGAGESSDAMQDDAKAAKGDDAAGQSAENASEQSGEKGSDKGAGSDSMNEQGSGEKADGEQGSGEQGASKQDGSEQQQGDAAKENAGETAEGKQGSDAKQGSDGKQSQSGTPQDAASKANQDTKPQGSESQSGQANESGSNSKSSPQAGQPQDASNDPSASSGQGSNGAGSGADTGEAAADLPPTPDPIDLDYAKKSTDMVLDYLEETRDQPDQELLEKLNWSEDDMQRFVDRWKSVRELDNANPNDPNAKSELTEALESLGMRPPTQATSQRREQSDALRGLRDSGNRTPPPAAYQDAFDSFRRAIGGK